LSRSEFTRRTELDNIVSAPSGRFPPPPSAPWREPRCGRVPTLARAKTRAPFAAVNVSYTAENHGRWAHTVPPPGSPMKTTRPIGNSHGLIAERCGLKCCGGVRRCAARDSDPWRSAAVYTHPARRFSFFERRGAPRPERGDKTCEKSFALALQLVRCASCR